MYPESQNPFEEVIMCSPETDVVKHRRTIEMQGQRPAPLMIQNESHKIRKAPREPVVIYIVPPEVIYVEASEGLPSSPSVNGKPVGSDRSSTSHGKKGNCQFPVRVKARALYRSSLEGGNSTRGPSAQSPVSPTLFLHDLSPLPFRVLTELQVPSWRLHESWS